MNFIENYSIEKIIPASYNPRKIGEKEFLKLQESLKKFGVCKGVVINIDGTIIAGHQRTKAMKAIGIKNLPVFVVKQKCAMHDEIRFNLIHNSVESEKIKAVIKDPESLSFGFSKVVSNRIVIIDDSGRRANYIKQICQLINKYGDFANVIIDESGNIIHNSDYAFCCLIMDRPLVVYKMKQDQVKEFMRYMEVDYGEYSYEALKIKPYTATFAQMHRGVNSTKHESYLYKSLVFNYMRQEKDKRLVDFGAGECYHVKQLESQGYKVKYYEPFTRKNCSTNALNISETVRMIESVEKDIEKNGLFDVVVSDSVINSITSNDFQDYVLTTCNALLAKNGKFFTSTRQIGSANGSYQSDTSERRNIEFLDNNNFSLTYRQNTFTLQKFHSEQSLEKLLKLYFRNVQVINKGKAMNLLAVCSEPIALSKEKYIEALNIEFNMEYPNGYRHNRHKKLVEAILKRH